MEKIKAYLTQHFEQIFVLLILVSVAGINYFIPYKLAFLNFYFIPVLMGAYYLGVQRALLGGVLCCLMVFLYAYLFPESFMPEFSILDLWMNILAWASFLILTGAMVGRLTNQLKTEVDRVTDMNETLKENKEKIESAEHELRDHAENLEKKVQERTDRLEKSNVAIEELKKRVEDALYSTMDAAVVKLIIEKRLRTEKRKISILFSDLKNFTQFSEERRPEVVITDLNRLLEEMEEVLLDYRAHIDKYLGDGIMVEFGAPVDFERHALMASLAGLKMQERLTKGGYPWKMRVGIATGEPIIGLIGQRRQTYTAIGDSVNLASRIQEICTPGRVMVDEPTYEEIHRFFDVQKKLFLSEASDESPEFVDQVNEYSERVEAEPENAELLKHLALLLLGQDYIEQAHEYLQRALQVDPNDQDIKLAFAETTMKLSQMDKVSIRGKKERLNLYELTGLKNPLLDRERIPQALYDQFSETVGQLIEYPEDIVLPVESMDGSVGHSKVVGFLSYALADSMGLTPQEKQEALQAGYLADVGKAIIPHHLLNRAGSLSKEEFEIVTKHSLESVRLLRKMGYESDSLFEIIEGTHENYTGSGYPKGQSGEEIPKASRIVAVADTYDALTSWRPYRDRWDYRAAFSEMERDTKKGKFDPEVIAALGTLLET